MKGCENMEIAEMRKLLNVSRADFSRIYSIPVRTLEDWESHKRKCPEYVLNLLERAVKEDSLEISALDATITLQKHKMDATVDDKLIISNRFL